MTNITKHLEWRYAVKKFDTEKKLTQEQVNELAEAMRLTASSYGLQPYKIMLVNDPEVRKKLGKHSWGQKQVTEASHLFVICNYTEIPDEVVDDYMEITGKVRHTPADKLKVFGEGIKSKISRLPSVKDWTAKQAYIVLGNLLTACAAMEIDACPMEGFVPEKYNEILGLNKLKLNAALAIPVGYRSPDDRYADMPKVRKPMEDFLLEV
jgi:nitroreductase